MRVFSEDDLDKAKAFFDRAGLPAKWVELPHQGRTLHVSDASGAPVEFCATMEGETAPHRRPSSTTAARLPQRIDHFQLLVPDVQKACEFWMSMGFRLSEYIAPDGTEDLLFVFLQRKGNPHDIVFCTRERAATPSRSVLDPGNPITSSMCAISPPRWALRANVEFGPGRHGPGHALFVYLRDPDGHRIELFNTHYQVMDMENEPVRWDASRAMQRRWQLAGTAAMVRRGEPVCRGCAARAHAQRAKPLSLEKFIAAGMR